MTAYTCHRAESKAGFKHGDGIRKHRQDWTIGEKVNVGFMRGLTVMKKNSDGSYELKSAKGDLYAFTPHQGISKI